MSPPQAAFVAALLSDARSILSQHHQRAKRDQDRQRQRRRDERVRRQRHALFIAQEIHGKAHAVRSEHAARGAASCGL